MRESVLDVDKRLLSQLRQRLIEGDVWEVNVKSGIETVREGVAGVIENLYDAVICTIIGCVVCVCVWGGGGGLLHSMIKGIGSNLFIITGDTEN